MQNQDFGSTQYFKVEKEPENGVKVILAAVYEALTEKAIIRLIRSSVISCPEIPPTSPATRTHGA